MIDESPTLLRVNDAGTRTPFFYLHGDLSGGGFYSLKLSRALGQDQPFYVLPPQDIRLLPAAPSIEEMAAAHLAALRAVRPKGPYVIGGFCIGGLVAYELAQQIEASGESVEMLLVIDATAEDKGIARVALAGWSARRAPSLGRSREGRSFWALGPLARTADAAGVDLNVRAQARVVFRRISNRFVRAYEMLRRPFRRRAPAIGRLRRNQMSPGGANTTCRRRSSGPPPVTVRGLITGRSPCSSPTTSCAAAGMWRNGRSSRRRSRCTL